MASKGLVNREGNIMARTTSADPREYMGLVIRTIKDKAVLEKFWKEIDNCQGPDDAIAICKRYIKMV